MSQADYDKHVPLGEKPTPGHSGKVCAEQEWLQKQHEDRFPNTLRSQQWCGFSRWLWGQEDGARTVLCCPACGIRLVPDEEPLPVPEGCDRVTVEETVIETYIYGWSELNIRHSHSAPTRAGCVAEWRRAFGKEKRDE